MPANMEKYYQEANAINEKDEELIKIGIDKKDTESIVSSTKSHEEQAEEDNNLPIDEGNFQPDRTFYILRHSLFSKEASTINITGAVTIPYSDGEISDEFRDAARGLSNDKARVSKPAYKIKGKHWWSKERTLTDVNDVELATWKHSAVSWGRAYIDFPSASPHSSHQLLLQNVKFYRRTNAWVQDSVPYSWRCNSKYKANRMSLLKNIGGKQVVVARYAQRWGSWVTGGVLLVDTREIDEVVAVSTAHVMLKRMQQRAAERSKYNGSGSG